MSAFTLTWMEYLSAHLTPRDNYATAMRLKLCDHSARRYRGVRRPSATNRRDTHERNCLAVR
jgi:hypothetical protein